MFSDDMDLDEGGDCDYESPSPPPRVLTRMGRRLDEMHRSVLNGMGGSGVPKPSNALAETIYGHRNKSEVANGLGKQVSFKIPRNANPKALARAWVQVEVEEDDPETQELNKILPVAMKVQAPKRRRRAKATSPAQAAAGNSSTPETSEAENSGTVAGTSAPNPGSDNASLKAEVGKIEDPGTGTPVTNEPGDHAKLGQIQSALEKSQFDELLSRYSSCSNGASGSDVEVQKPDDVSMEAVEIQPSQGANHLERRGISGSPKAKVARTRVKVEEDGSETLESKIPPSRRKAQKRVIRPKPPAQAPATPEADGNRTAPEIGKIKNEGTGADVIASPGHESSSHDSEAGDANNSGIKTPVIPKTFDFNKLDRSALDQVQFERLLMTDFMSPQQRKLYRTENDKRNILTIQNLFRFLDLRGSQRKADPDHKIFLMKYLARKESFLLLMEAILRVRDNKHLMETETLSGLFGRIIEGFRVQMQAEFDETKRQWEGMLHILM